MKQIPSAAVPIAADLADSAGMTQRAMALTTQAVLDHLGALAAEMIKALEIAVPENLAVLTVQATVDLEVFRRMNNESL